MECKVVFIDIDGTLLPFGRREVSPRNKQAISMIRSMGHKVYICTGRTGSSGFVLTKDEVDGYVTSSGANIYENDELIFEQSIDMKAIDDLVEFASHYEVGMFVNGKKGYLFGISRDLDREFSRRRLHHEDPQFLEKMRKEREEMLANGTDYHGDTIYKMGLNSESYDEVKPVIDYCKDKFTLVNGSIRDDGHYFYEITAKDMNKYYGIQQVCKYHDYSLDNVIALGDSMNDLEMVRDSKLGIAMDNAVDEIKQVADWITLSSEDDGVAYALNKIFNLNMEF